MGIVADHVDYFIILEAATTFTSSPKPLYVRENWSRFAQHHHKMILHTLNTTGAESSRTWDVEHFSRNAMYDQVLPFLSSPQEASYGDVIIVSDTIKALRNCDIPKELTMHTTMYYFSFQWLKRDTWPHPQATFYASAATILPSDLRHAHNANTAHLYNAG